MSSSLDVVFTLNSSARPREPNTAAGAGGFELSSRRPAPLAAGCGIMTSGATRRER
jgi:hypothetical protein